MARKLGRTTWQPPASMPPEIADAAHRLVDHWRDRIERRRSGPEATLQHTHRRCRLFAGYLLGLSNRPKFSEAQLAAAVDAYAAEPWHASNKAWKLLTDWLDDADQVERWVNQAAAARRDAIHAATKHREGVEAEQARRLAAQALGDAARRELARMERDAPEDLRRIEGNLLAGMTESGRRMMDRVAGGRATSGNCGALRAMALQEITRRLAAGGEQWKAALGGRPQEADHG